ncbi:MAG: hypothetical protein KAR21_08585, partial [Spirochaetales bacterium]|nr:hypothetical protein [Spirochaetales bacterium]
MQKTKFLAISVVLILAMVLPAAADQLELGMSLTPVVPEENTNDPNYDPNQSLILPGFHIGYRFAYIGFISWDSYVMPPEYITNMTATYDPDTGVYQPGPFRPGFLNTWNIGAKLVLGPLVGYSTVGLNTIYVYKQAEYEYMGEEFNSNFGANWKVGAGLKFGDWGLTLDLMALFPSFDSMQRDLSDLFG